MTDPFNELLRSLGKLLGLSLQADKNNACALQIKKGIIIQLQPDVAMEKIVIASQIIELPPGKFRENVLKEALKANDLPDPRVGIFSFLPSTNTLILFQQYPIDILTGERLAGLIVPFIDLAEQWRASIINGKLPIGNI